MSLPPAPPPSGGGEPHDPFGPTPGPFPAGPYPAGPYPADAPVPRPPSTGPGPYPAGPYPAGTYPAAPFPPYGTPAPPGYAPYGGPPVPPEQQAPWSGMAITGFVLALVGLLPCFWFWFQVPGVLGVIFSLLGLGATKHRERRGRGLAVAGLVIGLVGALITAGFTAFIYNTDDCVTNGFEIDCSFD